MENRKKGLTGSALKWIAIVTMFIDHVGAAVLTRILIYYPYVDGLSTSDDSYAVLYWVMRGMRTIGRIAFPIFCFLLVEGFQRTRNIHKYILRMAGFAVLAEIPLDLALSGKVINWEYQNVMVTLLLGMLTMWACSFLEKRYAEKKPLWIIGDAVCVAAGMGLAYLMHTDYSYKGIACIMILYFFRRNKVLQMVAGALSFLWEEPAMLAFPIISLYNGQRGMKMKYFFYLFYPLHLLLLYFVCVILGIEWISVV